MVRSGGDVKQIETGAARDEQIEGVGGRAPLDKVMAVRLSAIDWTELEGEAKELGIGPTTLVRMWILEHLRRQSGSPQDVLGAIDLFLQRAFREGIMIQTARDEGAELGALRTGILLQTPRAESGQINPRGSILFGNMIID
jgi:hypothetical protein